MSAIRTATLNVGERLSSRVRENPFRLATFVLVALVIPIAIALYRVDILFFFYLAAILWGWSEVDGLCGTSHVGSLTPLWTLDSRRRVWLASVSAYTLCGTVTAAIVGVSLGAFGHAVLGGFVLTTYSYVAVVVVAVFLTVRELEWLRFPLPQVRRQTYKAWGFQYGPATAAGMWGAHIGLAFATVVQHTGFYLLILLTITLGPEHGALLFATYWLGRALPMWIAPALRHLGAARIASGETDLPGLVHAPGSHYKLVAILGLIFSAVAAGVLIDASVEMF